MGDLIYNSVVIIGECGKVYLVDIIYNNESKEYRYVWIGTLAGILWS